jgi:hypothetical protein
MKVYSPKASTQVAFVNTAYTRAAFAIRVYSPKALHWPNGEEKPSELGATAT